ncbi:unnamed protein product [Cuscuta europaea]|uniref:Uncharacterized protein n=1 Tax=Cuscuta europaea TaxID=41803 RepID=A0A9P0ZNJ9_CUSEU|nr:unnamed protein product [Cuscuta europaea]
MLEKSFAKSLMSSPATNQLKSNLSPSKFQKASDSTSISVHRYPCSQLRASGIPSNSAPERRRRTLPRARHTCNKPNTIISQAPPESTISEMNSGVGIKLKLPLDRVYRLGPSGLTTIGLGQRPTHAYRMSFISFVLL